jgi:phosphoglycolate phosphatase-like HAD superfamily hydrolase
MRPLSEYEVLLFDCDGVILDSNQVKVDAFSDALREYPPQSVDRFLAYHRSTGGVSRYVKFREFFSDYVDVTDAPAKLARALDAFTTRARAGLLQAPLLPGLERVLVRVASPCYVVSGGDQAELRDVFVSRSLDQHFVEILGSPTTKEQHLERLGSEDRLSPPGVFFGDADKDMRVAEQFGLDFVFVSSVSDWPEGSQVAADRGHTVIADFSEVRL